MHLPRPPLEPPPPPALKGALPPAHAKPQDMSEEECVRSARRQDVSFRTIASQVMTRNLVTKYVCGSGHAQPPRPGKAQHSMILAVLEATTSARDSPALDLILKHGLEDRAIGVFTKVDRVEEEDYDLLLERLDNTRTAVPLVPHGYVATMNKTSELRPGEDALAQLHRQAQVCNATAPIYPYNAVPLSLGTCILVPPCPSAFALAVSLSPLEVPEHWDICRQQPVQVVRRKWLARRGRLPRVQQGHPLEVLAGLDVLAVLVYALYHTNIQ